MSIIRCGPQTKKTNKTKTHTHIKKENNPLAVRKLGPGRLLKEEGGML